MRNLISLWLIKNGRHFLWNRHELSLRNQDKVFQSKVWGAARGRNDPGQCESPSLGNTSGPWPLQVFFVLAWVVPWQNYQRKNSSVQGRFSPKVRISSAECRWPANNCDVQVFVKSSQTKREPTFKTRSGRRVGLAHAMLLERGFSHLNLYRYIHGPFFDCFLKVVSSCSSWEKLVSPSIYS